ncbi:MAG: stage sporulation protein SpoIID [Paenibacillaceae bacterium]|jgi:stage II sporulation protein D|nr:stage sporulation protein SpoIID [Paenibacillaceae bacterium]
MNWKPIRRATAVAVLAALLSTADAPFIGRAHAAPLVPEQIRVALILESGKLTSAVPAITLSSTSRLALTVLAGTTTSPWPADSALTASVRTTGDQYQVRLLETADFAKAKSLLEQISGTGVVASITTFTRSGKPVYQVTAGGYSTKEAASAALAAFKLQPVISVMAEKPVVRGPWRLNAGAYAKQADADKARDALAGIGLEAAVALKPKAGGGFSYEVWIGSETDSGSLAAYKLNALKLQSTLKLSEADISKPYILKLNDVTASANGTDAVSLLLMPVQGVKLTFAAPEGEVRVAEKASRTYRGTVEVSYHNAKLAAVNQLPFEQYLYSVVSKEMGVGWPAEALKAQAVAARSYALKSGLKYEIAHVSDSSLDQVYDGEEDADSIGAVDATAGEVLVDGNGPILAYFSANSGGMTSNGADVWGTAVPYLKVGPSPDEGAAESKALWHRGVLPDGQVAYIHSDYLRATGQNNTAGLPVYEITEQGVNARKAPFVDNTNNAPLAKLNTGDKVTVFDGAREANSYSWTRGPYTAAELLALMNAVLAEPVAGPLTSLEITGRGESGRVTQMKANGKVIPVSTSDAYRSVFGGLPSTRFEIERSGGYTIQRANGITAKAGSTMSALTGSGQTKPVDSSGYFVLRGDGGVDFANSEALFTIKGTGNGHGVGMSQWGARGWAELGQDYKKILSYYYEGVTLTKE